MTYCLLIAAVLFISNPFALAADKICTCKCVVKENGKYSTQEATGKDREEAGKKLKQALDKNTCELTPTCTGKCDSDAESASQKGINRRSSFPVAILN